MSYNHRSGSGQSQTAVRELAYGLGWFSIALGVAELVAPRRLARTFGMRGSEALIQAYGLREIATGIGILASENPTPWIWGRVAGDALDLATLAAGASRENRKRDNVAIAIAAVAGVTALDIYCGQALSSDGGQPSITYDYSDRSGFRQSPEAMRGAARDFQIPRDYQTPEALRPYTSAA